MLRCSGGSVRAFEDTSRSPTRISPSDGSRNPASSRNVVVLPQPDGPSRQTSWPWSILSETLSTTASEANRLVRPRNSTDANPITPQVSVFALRPRARRCRPLDYRWIDISTKKAAPKSLAPQKSEHRLDISAMAVRRLSHCERRLDLLPSLRGANGSRECAPDD